MNIIELLDKSKSKLGVNSDYALAKELEMNQGDITGYRKGTRRPTPYALCKIALLLDLDPLALIVEGEAQAEKNATRKGFWLNFLQSVGRVAGMLVLCSIATVGSMSAIAGGGFSRSRKFA